MHKYFFISNARAMLEIAIIVIVASLWIQAIYCNTA